jgi:predicted MPP superfamily phosphohydrolase
MIGIYLQPNKTAANLYNILGIFFIFHIYLFLYIVILHFLKQYIHKKFNKLLTILGLLGCIALVSYGVYNAQFYKITINEIKVKGLEKEISIIHLPDLHLGAQRDIKYLKSIINTIKQYNPDIVLYNGDLADSNIALTDELFSLFKDIKSEQYFTTGNHDFYIDTNNELKLINKAGIRILRSEMIVTHGLQLIGLEYMSADNKTYDAHRVNNLNIQDELPKIWRSEALPTVLVHHSPVGLEYVAQGKINVMLTGHTHGGQVFPGTLLIRLMFPKYKGLYTIDGLTLLVSQGAGTFGPWLRLGSFNEVQYIKLIPMK